MVSAESPKRNGLLAALPDADLRRWRLHLECIDLTSGQVLHEQGRSRASAYFPTSAVVAVTYVAEDGSCTEVGLVGAEGFIGASLILAGSATTTSNVVLIAGQAFRIGASVIRGEFEQSGAVRHLLLRYTQAFLTQVAQTAVCNRHHTVDQQLCGWLLHCLDRVQGREVLVTQEVLANMLGVRRESVTAVAGRLQADGLIRYARGHIQVRDLEALERRACECHAVVKNEYDRLLPPAETVAT